MKKILFMLTVLLTLSSCQGQSKRASERNAVAKTSEASQKTDAEWKAELTPEQYQVLREKGTERAFTGEYWNTFEKGKYVCAACGQTLFNSDSKFVSDCGWPSFDKAIKGAVTYHKDISYGMNRTEVLCSNCQSHLGHVFDDGPKETTGERFCTNSVSIKFVAAKK
ncbi:peptide-methionine (R)-S-oxide reductase MsrB [Flavobacterium antarcticum]|uniref:peptide-methionine (R)-S-oxide reductase MsrB n=1 Tax=Flavobacterium antarcticum TaxID=271155 RepID=UPI0003B3A916|nr:peptide-methionine (R)-S-oxide reductase MsrB [Flavobacterium antarcticum]